jgi:hypothetical protein
MKDKPGSPFKSIPGIASSYSPLHWKYKTKDGVVTLPFIAVDGCDMDLSPRPDVTANGAHNRYAKDYVRIGMPVGSFKRICNEVKMAVLKLGLAENMKQISLDWKNVKLHGDRVFSNMNLPDGINETLRMITPNEVPVTDKHGKPVLDTDGDVMTETIAIVSEPIPISGLYSPKADKEPTSSLFIKGTIFMEIG